MKNFQTIKISKELRMALGALRAIYSQVAQQHDVQFMEKYFNWQDPNVLYCFSDDLGRSDYPTDHPSTNLVDLQSDLIPAKTDPCQKVIQHLENGAVWTSGAKKGERVDWKGTTLSDSVFCFYLFQLAAVFSEVTLKVPALKGQIRNFTIVQQSWSGDHGEARFRSVTVKFDTFNDGCGTPILHTEPIVSMVKEKEPQIDHGKDFEPDDFDEYER